MHSSAFGAAARIIFRSLLSAARLSSLNETRYSSMFLGLQPWIVFLTGFSDEATI